MSITLTPQLEQAILKKVESGDYADASDVVREALKVLDAHEREVRLRAALQIGLDQFDRGEVVPWMPDTMERLIREGVEADKLGLPIKDDVKA